MKMKKSKYNFVYSRDNGDIVLYNTYSKGLVLVNKKEYEQYESLNFFDDDLSHTLHSNGFLIDDDFDETAFLNYCHNATKFEKNSLHIVLAITMDCNFGCPYCYENRRGGCMNESVQNAVVRFVKDNIEKGVRQFDITWYGGEPLLFPEIVESLGGRLSALADQYHCEIDSYIVTNGYLLTPEIIEMLYSHGISKLQITFDGLKPHHDLRRPLRNGDGTFDKIYTNLKLFEDYPMRVDIRMNVDNENCVDYPELQQLLAKLGNPNIVLYPSPVEDINPDTVNKVSSFMSFDEFERFASNMCSISAPTFETAVMDDRYCYCQAETENSYVIDEKGNCYKCWDQVGREKYSCFNLLDTEDKNYKNIVDFMGWDPFTDPKCSDCVFLPICFGGCKFHRMNTGKYDCGFSPDSMKRYIENKYFSD